MTRDADVKWTPAGPGGAPERPSNHASESREFVASRSVTSGDPSSPESNQAHANQRIDMSGAVIPENPATDISRWGRVAPLI